MGVFNNFPYANFHELNADWIIEQVRKVMDDWEEYKTDMDLWKLGVDDQLAEFQAWFDNLDVQDEVRTVINELIQSGEFIEIAGPQIVSATEAWLAAHITPTTPIVDDTLSISGAAADAKVTGDRTTDLKEDLDDVINLFNKGVSYKTTLTWGQGKLNPSNGNTVSSSNHVRTTYNSFPNESVIVFDSKALVLELFDYSNNSGTLSKYTLCGTGLNAVHITESHYYRFVLSKQDGTEITPNSEELNTIEVYGLVNVSDTAENIFDANIQPTNNKLDSLADFTSEPTSIINTDRFTKIPDTSIAPSGSGNTLQISSNNTYDSYYYVLLEDADVYFTASTFNFYLSLCYGEDYTGATTSAIYCSNASRKRSSDNDLPTSENKLTLKRGDVIAITIKKGNNADIYGLGLDYSFDFTQQMVAEIESIAGTKKPMVIYNDDMISNSNERLYIYQPMVNGYVKINFEHYENANINSDCWLIHPLKAVTDALEDRFDITTTGEFECAIKINGASDFMGGSAHGSEVVNEIHFFIDGEEVSPSAITSLTSFEVLRIVEQSNLYDPGDEVTVAAIHGKEYIFTKEDVTINQSVIWSGAYSLNTSYMAMLPIAKAVSPYYCPNDNYVTYETAEEYIRRSKIDSVITWDDVNDLSVRFSIPRWNINGTGITESGTFLITDNGTTTYNKEYYICTSGGSVQSGDLWRTTTKYEFEIGA